MADFSKPAVTQVYTEAFQDIRENQEELAKMFSGSIPSNTPTGAVRFLNGTFSTYNGSSFVASPIAIAGGGTGATTPSAVRSNFDLLSSAEISAQFVSGQAGTDSGEFRNNGQNDARFVQGQAGTSANQFRNNGQNDSRFVQGQAGTSDTQVQTNAQNRSEFAINSGENNSDFYQEAVLNAPSGDMTGGSCKVVRVGSMVTISGFFGHGSSQNVGTALNFLPSWATNSSSSSRNCYDAENFLIMATNQGALIFYYAGSSRPNTRDFTISYTV